MHQLCHSINNCLRSTGSKGVPCPMKVTVVPLRSKGGPYRHTRSKSTSAAPQRHALSYLATASRAFLTLISQWVHVIPFTFNSTVDMLSVGGRRLLNAVEAWSFYGAAFQL